MIFLLDKNIDIFSMGFIKILAKNRKFSFSERDGAIAEAPEYSWRRGIVVQIRHSAQFTLERIDASLF